MPFVATNPLSQRLAMLERLWQEFRRVPEARLCRWLFAPGEAWLLDVFLQEQAGPNAISNDIFVTLRTPVQHWQTYFEQVLKELAELVSNDITLLADRGLIINGLAETRNAREDPLTRFVADVNRLAAGLRAHMDGVLVLCLHPQTCSTPVRLDQILTALLQSQIAPDVRLLVLDNINEERLATLPVRFQKEVYSTPVDLQLQKVISQVAALGSPLAPDVKFRQWQAELTNAITQRNLRDVLFFASNCLLICQQQRWGVLEGSVHLSVAQAYMDHHRYEEALARYNQVIDQMEALFGAGNGPAGQISLVAWLGAGGVYEQLRQRQRAIDYYGLASERAETLQVWLLAMESHRRLGAAFTQAGRTQLSETHYLRLFMLAEHITPDQYQVARLPEIGRAYWQQQQTPEKRRRANERLIQLLGPHWRKASL